MSPRTSIDPILLEVLRNRLEAIADEMELTLLKSAASPVVLTADGGAVDELATKESREALRRERGRIDWLFDRGVDGRLA